MPPLSLADVLEAEYQAIEGTALPAEGPGRPEPERRAAIYANLHEQAQAKLREKPRSALCLSGGGIRSATFALGVVQSLARHKLLDKFHYLSTVSGGGYLGSWLTAWAHRHPQGLAGVSDALAAPAPPAPEAGPAPVRHLREYSNYLSPRVGLLSADTWTLAATYLRNLILNGLVLVPVLLIVLAVPRMCVAVINVEPRPWMASSALVLGFVLGVIALFYMGARRPSAQLGRAAAGDSGCADGAAVSPQKGDQGEFLTRCLAPLVGSAACLTTYWSWNAKLVPDEPAVGPGLEQVVSVPGAKWVVLFFVVAHVVSWILYSIKTRFRPAEGVVVVLTAVLAGLLASYAAGKVVPRPDWQVFRYVCVATPLFLSAFLVAGTLFVGLGSRWMNDDDREWAARMGAWVLIVTAVWLVGAPLVIFGPIWLVEAGRGVLVAASAAGGVSGLVTILLGGSGKTSASGSDDGGSGGLGLAREYSLAVAAPAFLAVLAILLTLLSDQILRDLSAGLRALSGLPWFGFLSFVPLANLPLNHAGITMSSPVALILLFVGLMATLALTMSFFVNVNKFSLHSMYRNRLIRAYLGASRTDQERRPNLFTGFDPGDNVGMSRLWPENCFNVPRRRLFPVVNCALNLVHGAKLAWQERKAEPFTISPLHCGNIRLGYRRSDEYARSDRGISLGTAVTISGAAANPNMGYHSSPLVTFLMTLFNARLGWWLGNPGEAGEETFGKSHPRQAVQPLIEEALGLTDDRNPYVNLSDGGHFDNLGLYEMVLRRCHLILVSDAGCDPQCGFEDLGNAVRKIRTDLGVPITFAELAVAEGPSGKCLKGGCALGVIDYAAVDGPAAFQGVILYLKPSLLAEAPVDVRSYARASSTFPHETTADQWFSESQFESYRALGSALSDEALDGLGADFAGKLVALQ